MTTPYERVIDALAAHVQVRDQGSNARAQCPAHESRGLTLAVRAGTTDDGRDKATVTCFASCETTDILAVIGLTLGDLYEPKTGPREYVPLKITRPTHDLGKAGVWDREELANHMANRSAAEELKRTVGPVLLALSDPSMLAQIYLGGTDERV
jgi:hypothetical protein